jgi:flagellar biosynthesis regulator FlbT
MEDILPFVKDIRRLKLKMFGNTTFVLSKNIRQNNKMASISPRKRLYFTAESTI